MNLIFCTSPLQALIAERIMELYPSEDFYCIFDGDPSNEKQYHYFQKIKSRCKDGIFITRTYYSNPIRAYLDALKSLYRGLTLAPINKVFLGSIESSTFRLILAGLKTYDIYTFDDGTINLSPQAFASMSYIEDGTFIKLLRTLFSIPTPQEVRNNNLKHYTIYPYPNVMEHCELLTLLPPNNFPSRQNSTQINTSVYSLFIGQRVCSYDNTQEDQALTQSIIKAHNIKYYLPHPKEDYHIEGVTYIKTPLIAEEYILQLLQENPHLKIKLYSYCSTTLLNLHNIPQIEVYAIKPPNILSTLQETYELYASIGIPVEILEEI